MFKFLFFITLIAIVYFMFFSKRKQFRPKKEKKITAETMIPCETCGVYVQAKETLMSDGKHYCCSQCLEKRS